MARKAPTSIQESLENNEDFNEFLIKHHKQLICLEVYSEFCGPCLATMHAVRRGKLEIGFDAIVMAKAASDNIDVLSRFRDRSEPVFLFITKGHLTRAVFGSNGIELCRTIEEELHYMGKPAEQRPKFAIDEMLPEEAEKAEADRKIEKETLEAKERLRTLTLAARKRRVCNRLAHHVKQLNFILFWPHNHQAHYDLYEKWDMINIQVGAKDTVQLKEEDLKEVLYMSDVDPNEACTHALLDGECLVVLFKMFDTDNRDFVKLLRYALYEEIPVPKEDVPPEKQVPPIPAFERYASISKTARQVRRDRYNAKLQKLQEEREERERLAAEQARMERQAEEERIAAEKKRREDEKMARIQAGLPAEPEPETELEPAIEGEKEETEGTETVPAEELEEEKVEAEEEFNSDIEVEGEDYIPPGGLFVPGLYAPPNELAKANGLAFFYPKIIASQAPIESEYLPPHVLVMFNVDKREDVSEVIKLFQDEILAVGVFVGEDLATAEHVAYSIKQYNKMERLRRHRDHLALMVSRKRSLPLLQLAGLNPYYISADTASGERDCLYLFPVGYADEFVEEESIVEEELPEVVPEPENQPEPQVEEPKDEDDDEEED